VVERPTRRLGRLAALFSLGLVAAIGLAEATARFAQAVGPPALRWYDATTQLKVEQMGDLGRADVVFAGTSMAWQGLVPRLFTNTDPAARTAYNAGLAGGVPVVMEPWLLEEVIPRLQPELVVWGLSSMDFSASYGDDNLDRYRDALDSRTGALASVEQTFARFSALVRYRSILRRPSAFLGIDANAIERDFANAASSLGEGGERRAFKTDVSDTHRDQVAARLRSFAIDGADIAAIHRTITALNDRGIEVILAEMPVPDRYIDLHPNGQADMDRVHATIVTIAELTDTRFIDLRNGYTDDDYVDFTHLDKSAARTLTRNLVHRVNGRKAILSTTSRAVDINDTVYHFLVGGGLKTGISEFWWGASHYGHSRDLATGAAGRDFEVLMTGDSRMLNAGNPGLFAELSGRATYNGALPNAGPELIDAWLRQQAIDVVDPDLIIYGIVPQQLRILRVLDDSCMADMSLWDEGLALRTGVFGPIEALTAEDSASVSFGDPPAEMPTIVSPIYRRYRDKFSILGQRDAFEQADEQAMLDWAAVLAESEAHPFKWCDERIDQYTATISWLNDQRIDVVSVILPIRPEFKTQMGIEQWDETVEELIRIATEAGSTAVIDLSDLLTPDLFRDQWHASEAGARLFTRTLAEEIAILGL